MTSYCYSYKMSFCTPHLLHFYDRIKNTFLISRQQTSSKYDRVHQLFAATNNNNHSCGTIINQGRIEWNERYAATSAGSLTWWTLFRATCPATGMSTKEEHQQTIQRVNILRIGNRFINILCSQESGILSCYEDEEVALSCYEKMICTERPNFLEVHHMNK